MDLLRIDLEFLLQFLFRETRFNNTLETNQVKIRALLILTPVKFHCGNDVEILTPIDSLANFPSLLPSTSIWGFFCLPHATATSKFHPIEKIAKGLFKRHIDEIYAIKSKKVLDIQFKLFICKFY